MVSFARPDDIGAIADVCQTFCVDNGAFSEWKRGRKMNVEGYARFCLKWRSHPSFDFAIVPDVIDGTEEQNEGLAAEWLNAHQCWKVASYPVWHLHESLRRLETLIDCASVGSIPFRWAGIALGSSGEYSQPGNLKWWERISQAMNICCDEEGRPRCKLHGLRMLDPNIFTKVPFSSADSTNAVRNGASEKRFGMYVAPNKWQRSAIIADRIESFQASATWEKTDTQLLFPNIREAETLL